MRFAYFVALAVSAGIAIAQDESPTKAKEAFDKAAIPTDLHFKEFNPKAVLEVSFPQVPQDSNQNPAPVPIECGGAQLPENNTAKPPTFNLRAPGKPVNVGNGPFVIAMIDPDAPTPQDPNGAPVRHFLGGDFAFKEDGVSLVNNTAAISEYKPPSPPKGSKPHRYVFLVFNQPKGFDEQKEVTPETGREGFNVSQFAEKMGLGEPVAGTYMLVGPQN